jgi:hypothetical protein
MLATRGGGSCALRRAVSAAFGSPVTTTTLPRSHHAAAPWTVHHASPFENASCQKKRNAVRFYNNVKRDTAVRFYNNVKRDTVIRGVATSAARASHDLAAVAAVGSCARVRIQFYPKLESAWFGDSTVEPEMKCDILVSSLCFQMGLLAPLTPRGRCGGSSPAPSSATRCRYQTAS